jgi:hypothetical protein
MVFALPSPLNILLFWRHAFTHVSFGLTAMANVTNLQTVAQNGRANLFLNVKQRAVPIDT